MWLNYLSLDQLTCWFQLLKKTHKINFQGKTSFSLESTLFDINLFIAHLFTSLRNLHFKDVTFMYAKHIIKTQHATHWHAILKKLHVYVSNFPTNHELKSCSFTNTQKLSMNLLRLFLYFYPLVPLHAFNFFSPSLIFL